MNRSPFGDTMNKNFHRDAISQMPRRQLQLFCKQLIGENDKLKMALIDWLAATPTNKDGRYSLIHEPHAHHAVKLLESLNGI